MTSFFRSLACSYNAAKKDIEKTLFGTKTKRVGCACIIAVMVAVLMADSLANFDPTKFGMGFMWLIETAAFFYIMLQTKYEEKTEDFALAFSLAVFAAAYSVAASWQIMFFVSSALFSAWAMLLFVKKIENN